MEHLRRKNHPAPLYRRHTNLHLLSKSTHRIVKRIFRRAPTHPGDIAIQPKSGTISFPLDFGFFFKQETKASGSNSIRQRKLFGLTELRTDLRCVIRPLVVQTNTPHVFTPTYWWNLSACREIRIINEVELLRRADVLIVCPRGEKLLQVT